MVWFDVKSSRNVLILKEQSQCLRSLSLISMLLGFLALYSESMRFLVVYLAHELPKSLNINLRLSCLVGVNPKSIKLVNTIVENDRVSVDSSEGL